MKKVFIILGIVCLQINNANIDLTTNQRFNYRIASDQARISLMYRVSQASSTAQANTASNLPTSGIELETRSKDGQADTRTKINDKTKIVRQDTDIKRVDRGDKVVTRRTAYPKDYQLITIFTAAGQFLSYSEMLTQGAESAGQLDYAIESVDANTNFDLSYETAGATNPDSIDGNSLPTTFNFSTNGSAQFSGITDADLAG